MTGKEKKSAEHRRVGRLKVSGGKRAGIDRSRLMKKSSRHVDIMQKIPLFKGLSFEQFLKVLKLCTKREYAPGDVVCKAGHESHQMYILITGALKVETPDGRSLAEIVPVDIVGEMGVFTGEVRSASVLAKDASIALVLQKIDLINLFRRDGDLGLKVMLNVILDLSHKLQKSNETIRLLKQVCPTDMYEMMLTHQFDKQAVEEYWDDMPACDDEVDFDDE